VRAAATFSASEVFDLLRDDLVAIEHEFERESISSVGSITAISEYLRAGGGKRIRPALLRFRVIAYAVGIALVVLVVVGVPLRIWGYDPTLVRVLGPIHGGLYSLYLIAAADLVRRLRHALRDGRRSRRPHARGAADRLRARRDIAAAEPASNGLAAH